MICVAACPDSWRSCLRHENPGGGGGGRGGGGDGKQPAVPPMWFPCQVAQAFSTELEGFAPSTLPSSMSVCRAEAERDIYSPLYLRIAAPTGLRNFKR